MNMRSKFSSYVTKRLAASTGVLAFSVIMISGCFQISCDVIGRRAAWIFVYHKSLIFDPISGNIYSSISMFFITLAIYVYAKKHIVGMNFAYAVTAIAIWNFVAASDPYDPNTYSLEF